AYFLGDDNGGAGFEVWRTDGTANGTAMVANLAPGAESIDYVGMAAFNNALVISLRSPAGTADGVYCLSNSSTAPVRIRTDTYNYVYGARFPTPRVYFRNIAYSINAPPVESLWVTDCTTAG